MPASDNPYLSVVIPICNERDNLSPLTGQILKALSGQVPSFAQGKGASVRMPTLQLTSSRTASAGRVTVARPPPAARGLQRGAAAR